MHDKDVSSKNTEYEVTESNDRRVDTSSHYSGISSIASLGHLLNNINFTLPSDLLREFNESIKSIYINFAPISLAINSLQNAINEIIKPTIERLSQLYSDINWGQIAEGSKGWGAYGWIPPEELSIIQILQPPATLKEADQIALSVLNAEQLEILFYDLSSSVPKRKDIEEAVLLFKSRHYKATAMMLCSLIECELIKADKQSTWRKPKNAIDRLDTELPSKGFILITAPALANAYDYFFHSGDNFDRLVEGELNRNFLQHGMMYKPVRRKTCIKLFLILREVVHLTHL